MRQARLNRGGPALVLLACHRFPPQDASERAARQPVRSDGSSGIAQPPVGRRRRTAPRSGSLGGRCIPANRCWTGVGVAGVVAICRCECSQVNRHGTIKRQRWRWEKLCHAAAFRGGRAYVTPSVLPYAHVSLFTLQRFPQPRFPAKRGNGG